VTDNTRELDFLYDVELELSVVLGTSRMLIRELLQLQSGSVVELSKLAGESLDVVINDKVVARGEAVVVNEKFGIRLTEVVSPFERVQHLRD
jgi:flagellar motor switch protein FliN/FliY